jgi:hypothetical protein
MMMAGFFSRHSGARALRKIDYVNFVAKPANPESRNIGCFAGFRVRAEEARAGMTVE